VKVSDYNTERRGFVVSSVMGHVMTNGLSFRMGGAYYQMYRPEWKTANSNLPEVESIRAERNKEIDRLLAVPPPKGFYGVTPASPGNSYF
jgi:hypothetical protein